MKNIELISPDYTNENTNNLSPTDELATNYNLQNSFYIQLIFSYIIYRIIVKGFKYAKANCNKRQSV